MTNNSEIDSNLLQQSWLKVSIENFNKKVEIIYHYPWLKVEKGFRYREEIEVFNVPIFGDDKGHKLVMRFFDGFAVQLTDDDSDAPLIMIYPTGSYLWNDKDMPSDIIDFAGNDYVTPFEVALKYGKLFTYEQVLKGL